MPEKNKTELISEINTVFQPTLDLPDHRGFLDGDLVDSVFLGKHRVVNQTATSDSFNVDFTDAELVILDCDGRDVTLTTSNNAGRVVFLWLDNYLSHNLGLGAGRLPVLQIGLAFTKLVIMHGHVYNLETSAGSQSIISSPDTFDFKVFMSDFRQFGQGFENPKPVYYLQYSEAQATIDNGPPLETGGGTYRLKITLEGQAGPSSVHTVTVEQLPQGSGSSIQYSLHKGWWEVLSNDITWTTLHSVDVP